MSSVTIDTPAVQRGHEELVPSRYAVRIGDIDVLIISDGVLPIPAKVMATNADDATLHGWLDSMYMPPDTFDWALNAMLVRSGDQVILIDAGLGGQFPGFPRAGLLQSRLRGAGIDLSDLTDIVITHMHMDHVGGLLVEGVKERLRPDVRIHVSAAEVEFWKAPDFSRVWMPEAVPPVLRATATKFAQMYADRIVTFADRKEVAPGVVARRTGGHTPGHSVVEVIAGDERLLFAGDAVFPVGFEHPEWTNGFEHDPEEARNVRFGLFRELAENRGLMVATHVPFPSLGHVAIDGDAFRWVPVNWDF